MKQTIIGMLFVLLLGAGVLSQQTPGAGGTKDGKDNEPMLVPHVCGIVLDPSGGPIPNATVKILRDGTKIVQAQTSKQGEFSFRRLKAGRYDLQALASGFQTVRLTVTVTRPTTRCDLPLRIQMPIGLTGSPTVYPPSRSLTKAFEAITAIQEFAEWRVDSNPAFGFSNPAQRCNIGDLSRYTASRLDYEVAPTVDDHTATKRVKALDSRVVQYLRETGWLRLRAEGLSTGIPDLSRCYRGDRSIIQVFQTTGRCTMNSPCRAYDGLAVIVYSSLDRDPAR